MWVVEVIRCKQPGRWFKKNIPPYAQAICRKTLILNALAIYIGLNSKYKTILPIHNRTIVYAYITLIASMHLNNIHMLDLVSVHFPGHHSVQVFGHPGCTLSWTPAVHFIGRLPDHHMAFFCTFLLPFYPIKVTLIPSKNYRTLSIFRNEQKKLSKKFTF